jgi:hypothetical protein
MSAEDRDRLFEKALARQLRSEAGAAGDSACLDAEALAAYHERQLATEEMMLAKGHIVACARCRQILAQLEMTQGVQESLDQEHVVIAATGAPDSLASVRPPTSGKVAHFPGKKTSLLRWAAPAGAIAAGILIWVGVREYRAEHPAMSSGVQIAENRNQAAPAPEAVPAAPEPRTKQKSSVNAPEDNRRQQSLRRSDVLRDQAPASRSANQPPAGADGSRPAFALRKALPRSVGEGAGAGAGGRLGGRIGARASEAGPLAAAKPSAKKEDLDANDKIASYSYETGPEPQKSEVQSLAAVGGVPAAAPPPPPASSAPKAAPVPSASQTVEVTGQAVSESVEVSSSAAQLKDEKQLALTARNVLALKSLQSAATSPDGKNIWRFGEHGEIAHSADGGSSWESQVAPLTATLTSGSAPSKKVCWIAGAAGTLLRTTDRGKHWQMVTTPIAADLGGVQASDGKHAIVWDAGNRMRYETSDGGVTWHSAANQ